MPKCEPKVLAPLTHSHTMAPFDRVWERSLLKTLWEKEKLLIQAISPFPKMFSSLSKTEIIIFVAFNILHSSANASVWSGPKLCCVGMG